MNFKNYIIKILIILFVVFVLLISQGNIGVAKGDIEKDAGKGSKIPEEWITAKDINKDLASLLFYSEDLSNFTISIYQKRSGLSFGYFFRLGGSLPGVSEKISKITTNDQGDIFLSMNKLQISRIEVDNGIDTKEILIENTKPFTIIVPEDSGEIRFYDINENLISDDIIIESQL